MEKWHKMLKYVYVPSEKFSTSRVNLSDVEARNILGEHGCGCPGFLHCQIINSDGTTYMMLYRCQNFKQIFPGLTYNLLLRFTVILDVYRFFIPNKTALAEYCLTQWVSKLFGSIEIYWVRQCLVHFMGLVGIVNVTTVKCRYNAVFGVQEIDRVIAVTAL